MGKPQAGSRRPYVLFLMGFLSAAAMAVGARGLAGDEEAAHFLMARYALEQPELFLSMVGRPLVTIALSLPAQLGLVASRLASATAAGLCGLALARIAAATGWISPAWMVALLFVQPFFLAHAGTAMTEPWAAAILAWGTLAFVERRYRLLAVLAALSPLARMETLALWPFVVWVLAASRRLRLLLVLPVSLILWNLGGAAASGDWLWLLHQSNWQAYPQREWLHYAESFAWITGAGLFVPVLVGLVRTALLPWRRFDREEAGPSFRVAARRRTLYAAGLLTLTFFGVYTLLAVWHPVTFGNLRYFAYAAPGFAMLAAAGLHAIRARGRAWVWAALLAAALGAGLVWNHPLYEDFAILRKNYPAPLILALAWIGLYTLPARMRRLAPLLAVGAALAVLPLDYRTTLHLEPAPEEAAVRRAASLLAPLPPSARLYTSHPLIALYRGGNLYDPEVYPPVTDRITEAAKPGTLFFWETHYAVPRAQSLGVRPFFDNPAWRYAGGVVASDSSWAGGYFLRVDPADSTRRYPEADLVRGGLPEESWKEATTLIQAGVPVGRANTRIDPRNDAFWRTLGQRLSSVGRLDEAWKALERAVQLAPSHPYNHAYRAEILRFQQDLDGAYREARKALALEPDDGMLLYLNARLLLDLERDREALPVLARAADRLAKRWDIQWVTAQEFYKRERWEEAETYALRTLVLRPPHAEAAVMAAEIAWRRGDRELAKDRIRAFIQQRPAEAVPYLILGDILRSEGRKEEARQLWEEGLRKTGGDSDIASRLRSLDP